MNAHPHQAPFNRGPSRVLLLYAHLASFMLVSPALYAQTHLGQTQLSPVPTEFQMNLIPTRSADRIRLAIGNPRQQTVRIQLLDEQGRSYYEAYEARSKMIIPFDVSSAPPGTYTVAVSTSRARHTQTFVIEPPTVKRVRLYPDRPDPDWVVTTEVELKHRR